jgi:hypothetical protein
VAELPRDCGLDIPSPEEEGILPHPAEEAQANVKAWCEQCLKPVKVHSRAMIN